MGKKRAKRTSKPIEPPTSPPAASPIPAKKPVRGAKKAFVASLPDLDDITGEEAVRRAEQQTGLHISVGHFYNLRCIVQKERKRTVRSPEATVRSTRAQGPTAPPATKIDVASESDAFVTLMKGLAAWGLCEVEKVTLRRPERKDRVR